MTKLIDVNTKILFGCEIEFNSPNNISYINNIRRKEKNIFNVEYDSDKENIKEAISPILTNSIEDLNQLKKILKIIKKCGGYILGNEGAHIHFDHSIIKEENISTMLKLWYLSENIIYKFAKCDSKHLRTGYYTYAKELGRNLRSMIINYDNGLKNIHNLIIYNRLYGLNLSNYINHTKNKNTIEVRVLNGTLDYDTWINGLTFFSRFFNFANDEKNKKQINYLFNIKDNLTDEELSDLIYEKEKSKKLFLNQVRGVNNE